MSFVFILHSPILDEYYIGRAQDDQDLKIRLWQHNAGANKQTKEGRPWEVKYKIPSDSKEEALSLERKLRRKSKEEIAELIKSGIETSV